MNSISILPLDLSDLRKVHSFSQQARAELGTQRLDYLFLNAGTLDSGNGPGPHGSLWCEGYVVNHLGKCAGDGRMRPPSNKEIAQHYLVHLFRETLAASKSRLVVVSSGAIRSLRGQDPSKMPV